MKQAAMVMALALAVVTVTATPAPEAAAEQQRDWDAALAHYETLYGATLTDDATRSELRTKFAELRQKVPSNTETNRAGVWRVRAYAFRSLDFQWTDKGGQARHARWTMRDDEVAFIRAALGAFADRVWEYTSGSLRIDWRFTIIEQPLTKLDGKDRFWPGPGACMPYLSELKTNEADTIIVYAKVRGDKSESGEAVPMALLGGAFGVLGETKGATYIGFNTGGGMVSHEPRGEAELHEWLHSAQWTLEDHQGYPRGLMCTSDGGRREGEEGGDPCYRRTKEEPGWVGYYRHLMQTHVTRKMWRELSVTRTPDNVWIGQYARRALALGPFPAAGQPQLGIDRAYIDEARASPRLGARDGGLTWQPLVSTGRTLDMIPLLGAGRDSVCYLALTAISEREQPAQIRVGSDDGCRVWLNGEAVSSAPGLRALRPDQDVAGVTLKKGRNLFLMKVTNAGGGWCATFRLCAPDGGPLPGAAYAE